jgi:hypothetical protein
MDKQRIVPVKYWRERRLVLGVLRSLRPPGRGAWRRGALAMGGDEWPRATYQAIALANTVKPAKEKNARKSLVLIPNRECCVSLPTAVCLSGDRVLSISIEEAWASSTVIWAALAARWARLRQPEAPAI